MHYEFMGLRRSPYVDSVQFHVSSSLAKAEEYVRKLHVQSHSWWQVHPHLVDDPDHLLDEGQEVYYYSHRGTRLKTAPWKRARAAFDKLPDSRIGP
jgi:hypothetical protein